MKDGNGRELSFVELEELLIGGNMSEVVETSFSRRMDALYAEGIERERKLLCRQAAKRFDAETAERLAVALAVIDDPQRLEDVGDWVIDSRTADELIARAGDPTV